MIHITTLTFLNDARQMIANVFELIELSDVLLEEDFSNSARLDPQLGRRRVGLI